MRRRAEAAATLLLAACLGGCLAPPPPASLRVFGPYTEREADVFAEVIAAFERETGIRVRFTGSAAFAPDLAGRIGAGDLPDVAILTQPNAVVDLEAAGALAPLGSEAGERVRRTVGPGWDDVIVRGGRVVAVPYRMVVKSLVWYRADVFARRGYPLPATLEDLAALAARMRRDGLTPWCAGMNDFASTGWWATDWVEDLVLRRNGREFYAAWSRLEAPFDGEEVVGALEAFDAMIGARDHVAGGRRAVIDTLLTSAIDPMFESPPGCLMLKQASFQTAWLPRKVAFGDGRLDVFPLPPVGGGPPPILIGGEIAVATSASPEAQRFLEFLLEDRAAEPWRSLGGSLAARAQRADTGSPLDRKLDGMLARAPAVAFDASDLMPRAVGSRAFWKGMVRLVAGAPPRQVAAEIQQAVVEFKRAQGR